MSCFKNIGLDIKKVKQFFSFVVLFFCKNLLSVRTSDDIENNLQRATSNMATTVLVYHAVAREDAVEMVKKCGLASFIARVRSVDKVCGYRPFMDIFRPDIHPKDLEGCRINELEDFENEVEDPDVGVESDQIFFAPQGGWVTAGREQVALRVDPDKTYVYNNLFKVSNLHTKSAQNLFQLYQASKMTLTDYLAIQEQVKRMKMLRPGVNVYCNSITGAPFYEDQMKVQAEHAVGYRPEIPFAVDNIPAKDLVFLDGVKGFDDYWCYMNDMKRNCFAYIPKSRVPGFWHRSTKP